MRKTLPIGFIVFALALFASGRAMAQETAPIDNSALIPKIVPDAQVQMEGMSPNWVKSLIIAEVRLETATPEGTFAAATRVLDHYAEMGVNCLWIDPIWGRSLATQDRNGYGNYCLRSVYSALTGTDDVDASLAQVKAFVDEAHRRNIRILFDVVVWGTAKDAPLVKEHPEFYVHNADGQMNSVWGGWQFDWNSEALKNWYRDAAVDFINKTGADGFRVDLAPDTSGYFFKEVRDVLATQGRKIVGMQQQGNGGTLRFYTSTLLDHDDPAPFAQGNRVRFAYATLFAPYLPMWWIGEEWNNPLKWVSGAAGVMYFNTIDWSQLDVPTNRAFYEDVKRYIRIRRSYPDIFEYFADNARQANIGAVDSKRDGAPNPLQAYGRFANGRAILIVPNYTDSDGTYTITPDRTSLGLDIDAVYKITDLMSGAALKDNLDSFTSSFAATIPAQHLGIYLLEKK